MLIFDTSILIALEKNDKAIIKKISELSKIYRGTPQTTFITYYEFLLGIKNRSFKNQSKAIEFLNNFNCLKASSTTAQILAELKNKYEKKGIHLGLADLIIASHAKEWSMILVTKDKTFEKLDDINKIIIE